MSEEDKKSPRTTLEEALEPGAEINRSTDDAIVGLFRSMQGTFQAKTENLEDKPILARRRRPRILID
jgi:hypothetical protein